MSRAIPDWPERLDHALAAAGLRPQAFDELRAAARYSARLVGQARALLEDFVLPEGVAAFAVGSLGRAEASVCSDLDLCLVYTGEAPFHPTALPGRAPPEPRLDEAIYARLAPHFDVPRKTFREFKALDELVANVGGEEDHNQALTYRALLLSESVCLAGRAAGEAQRRRIFEAYANYPVTRGRHLGSLANDLHRYYRTLCLDYRHKVERQDKSWALRAIKLRHTRKLWHLANLLQHQAWTERSLSDHSADAALREGLLDPPLLRLASALAELGIPEELETIAATHDRYCAAMASPATRAELLALDWGDRGESELWRALDDNADQFDAAASALLRRLLRQGGAAILRYWVL